MREIELSKDARRMLALAVVLRAEQLPRALAVMRRLVAESRAAMDWSGPRAHRKPS